MSTFRRLVIRTVQVTIWLIACAAAYSQTAERDRIAPSRRFVTDIWTTAHGLPQNTITAIAQTPDGFLWLGTRGGLARFDGQDFTVFDKETTDGVVNNDVLSLLVTREGDLVVGFENGTLSRYHDRVFEKLPAQAPSGGAILTMLEEPDGRLLLGTDGDGLARFDGRGIHPLAPVAHGPETTVYSLLRDDGESIWIGTEGNGLARFDGKNLTRAGDPSLRGATVLSIGSVSDGSIVLGTAARGAFRLVDGGSSTPLSGMGTTNGNRSPVTAIASDHAGHLWLGTRRGLFADLGDGLRRMGIQHHGVEVESITTLMVDSDNSLWIGSDNGLSRLKPAVIDVLTETSGTVLDPPLAVLEDRTGSVWIGTDCGGLIRFRDGALERFDRPDALLSRCVWSLHEDGDGALWIGTRNGLNRLTTGRVASYTTANGLLDEFVVSLASDSEGALWAGTRRGGLNRLDGDRFTAYTTSDGLGGNWVRSIVPDENGDLWVATSGGLSRYQDGAFRNYTTANGLSSNDVRTLHLDSDGALWAGTYDAGINRFENGRITAVTTGEGLSDNRISTILEDNFGNLWMGGNRGIQRVAKRAIEDLAEGRSTRLASVLYGRDDGLLNPECRGGFQPSGWSGSDGRLWFPTLNGVAVVSPARLLRADAEPLPALITGVIGNGHSIESGRRLTDAQGRNISFSYTSPALGSPSRLRFRFMLEGLDSHWVEAGNRREAQYRALRPGNYTFRVKASRDGVTWSREVASRAVLVPARFYQTSWFLTVCLIGLLTGLVVVYRRTTRRIRGRASRLRKLVEQRTAELRTENERVRQALDEAERQTHIAESARATVEEQSAHLQRLDHLKSQFFANISHEFRTPLTLIVDPLERAVKGSYGDLSPELERDLNVARRNGRRLLQLLKQLLDLARIDAGSMELHRVYENICPLLKNVIQAFTSEAHRLQIALRLTLSHEAIFLPFDRDKLEAVVYNLVSNALNATPAGGKILVTAREVELDACRTLEIAVRDTGIGIPADQLATIFDRFHRVERPSSSSGTGIGLSLTKELVELHGGSIDVESVPGFGSAFTVRMPIETEHIPVERETAADVSTVDYDDFDHPYSGASGDLTRAAKGDPTPVKQTIDPATPVVLVVEDDADMRDLICRQLSAYRIETAENGLEGIAKARALRPDLVISDLVMPEMEGIAFCRLLKQNPDLRGIPVILLTGLASMEDRLEGLQVGADDFIQKPFTRQELVTRVDNLIEMRRVLREQFSREVILKPAGVAVPSADAAFLERLVDIVELHLQDPNFTVRALAQEAGVSEAQLKRKVRAVAGQAPVEFVRRLRLERAAELFRQRTGNVGEVAFATGFNNLSYFAKCFREHFGKTPSEYLADPS